MANIIPLYRDTPLSLIHTPKFENAEDGSFTVEASHMALSHNAFIRGFNSIYQQAPRLSTHTDKLNFIGYSFAWIDCVKTHYQYEETDLIPNINKAAEMTHLMEDAGHEHEAFYGGMDRMRAYLQGQGANFLATELITIMDSFKDALHSHLKAKPPAIVALAKYNTPENTIDILGIADAAVAGRKNIVAGVCKIRH